MFRGARPVPDLRGFTLGTFLSFYVLECVRYRLGRIVCSPSHLGLYDRFRLWQFADSLIAAIRQWDLSIPIGGVRNSQEKHEKLDFVQWVDRTTVALDQSMKYTSLSLSPSLASSSGDWV